MGMTPAKAAFDSTSIRAVPQSRMLYTSSSVGRPGLAELVDNWPCVYMRSQLGILKTWGILEMV